MFVRVPRGPNRGYRCYVLGRRLHHGVTGIVLATLGAAMVVHDRRDAKVWFSRDRFMDSSNIEQMSRDLDALASKE